MTFTVALMIAVSYWGARDIQTPCHPQLVNASQVQMAAWDGTGIFENGKLVAKHAGMRAAPWSCTIYQGALARGQARLYAPPWCAQIVHEVGHIDGLSHAYGGVMSAEGPSRIPWGCWHPQRWMRRHRHHGQIMLAQPG